MKNKLKEFVDRFNKRWGWFLCPTSKQGKEIQNSKWTQQKQQPFQYQVFLLLICVIGIIYGLPGLVDDFTEDWEEEEDRELERKFKEYDNKKSQDD